MFAPLVFVMVMSFGVNRLSTFAMQAMFWAYAAVMGLSLASIFLVYTGTSIAQPFFATAAAFAGLSLWGYTTTTDLAGFGTRSEVRRVGRECVRTFSSSVAPYHSKKK